MRRFYVCMPNGMSVYESPEDAEAGFDICYYAGVSPLFLIEADGDTGDFEPLQWTVR